MQRPRQMKKKKNQHHGRPQILSLPFFSFSSFALCSNDKQTGMKSALKRMLCAHCLQLDVDERGKGLEENQIIVACAKENQENRCECR